MLFEQMFERHKMTKRILAEVGVDPAGAPTRFLWQGRHYLVRAVLLSWLESALWWQRFCADRQIWRVLASSSRDGTEGVYDIAKEIVQRDERVHTRWYIRKVLD